VSQLAVRDQLTQVRELSDGEVLVLLTDTTDLGESIISRLARQRLHKQIGQHDGRRREVVLIEWRSPAI
jgi:hypothetical protein